MSEQSKNNPVKGLRESFNERRAETLKRAQANARKSEKAKKDEQAAHPAGSSRKDLDL